MRSCARAASREVLTALRRTFITPFDRGGIKDLITSMDDAIDQMKKTAHVITLFELRTFARPMQDMGEIIVRAAELTVQAVELLGTLASNTNRLNALTEELRNDQVAMPLKGSKTRRASSISSAHNVGWPRLAISRISFSWWRRGPCIRRSVGLCEVPPFLVCHRFA
jgi:Protein of unknown function DUF47